MIGKCFQVGYGYFYNTAIYNYQAQQTADQTTRDEKALKNKNFSSQKHADQEHDCQTAEQQHRIKWERNLHIRSQEKYRLTTVARKGYKLPTRNDK